MLQKRYPKEVVLKDGDEVILRPLEPEDEEALARFYQNMKASDRWFMTEDPCDRSVIQSWLRNQERGQAFCVLATFKDDIVAHGSIFIRIYGGRKHVGFLRIMVGPDFRGKRLGTWMIVDLVRRAMDLGLEKIRTDFVVGIEDAAIEAVRKQGFIQEGLLKEEARDEKGHYYDCQIMVKYLHKEWSDF